MKKLLSIFAAATIFSSSSEVASCSYINFYKQSIINKVDELVKTSSLALYAPIAGAAGVDGKYAYTWLNNQHVNDFTKFKDSSSIDSALNSYFGDDFNIYKTLTNNNANDPKANANISGLTDEDAKSFFGAPFEGSAWSTIEGFYNTIYGIIGQGISPQLVETIVNILGVLRLKTPEMASLDKTLSGIKVDALGQWKKDFAAKNSLAKKNKDYLYWFYSDLTNLLAKLTKDTKTNDAIDLNTLIAAEQNDVKSGPESLIIKSLGSEIGQLLTGKTTFNFDLNSILELLPSLAFSISNYFDAFNDMRRSDLSKATNITDNQLNHILSIDNVNLDVIKKVSNQAIKTKVADPKDYNFSGIVKILSSIFEPSLSSEYEIDRTLQILFQSNSVTSGFRLANTPSKGDGTNKPEYDVNSPANGLLINHGVQKIEWPIPVEVPTISAGEWAGNGYSYQYGLTPLLSGLSSGILDMVFKNLSGPIQSILNILGLGQKNLSNFLGNLISALLANNNVSSILNNLITDLSGVLNFSVIHGILNIDPSILEPLRPIIKKLAPYFDKAFTQLFIGTELLPQLWNLLETIGIALPDNIKKIKNINDLLGMSVTIFDTDVSIADIIPLIISILNTLLQNWDNLYLLISKISGPLPSELTNVNTKIWNGNNDVVGTGKGDGTILLNGSDSFKTVLGFALAMSNVDLIGYSINFGSQSFRTKKIKDDDPIESDTGLVSAHDYAGVILGYDSQNKKIEPDSFFGILQDMYAESRGITMRNTFNGLKSFIDHNSKSFANEQNNEVKSFIKPNLFAISDIDYDNFSNASNPSKVEYTINYHRGDFKISYRVEIENDPKGNNPQFYQFTKLERIK